MWSASPLWKYSGRQSAVRQSAVYLGSSGSGRVHWARSYWRRTYSGDAMSDLGGAEYWRGATAGLLVIAAYATDGPSLSAAAVLVAGSSWTARWSSAGTTSATKSEAGRSAPG